MTQAKTAMVTGGSGGIGSELCRRLAKDGFQVVVHYGSNQAEAEKVVEEICRGGGKAIACSANVADEAEVQHLFDTAVKQLGGIDVVVANAGTSGGAPIQDLELDVFDRVVAVNFRAAFLTMREAARRLRENGRIIFISSLLARRPMAGTGVYSATKAAMDAMVVSLSLELGERGITVNSVRPGATVPGMFGKSDPERKEKFRQMSPFKRLGTPADIAAAVSFLASEDGAWITGQVLSADGGASSH